MTLQPGNITRDSANNTVTITGTVDWRNIQDGLGLARQSTDFSVTLPVAGTPFAPGFTFDPPPPQGGDLALGQGARVSVGDPKFSSEVDQGANLGYGLYALSQNLAPDSPLNALAPLGLYISTFTTPFNVGRLDGDQDWQVLIGFNADFTAVTQVDIGLLIEQPVFGTDFFTSEQYFGTDRAASPILVADLTAPPQFVPTNGADIFDHSAESTALTLDALDGDDRVQGGSAGDALTGSGGNDRLLGNGGPDTLEGGDGADTLNGGDGDDFIFGGRSASDLRDVILAGAGNDNIDAGAGNDEVFGADGNDTIAGGAGVDTLQGQNGDDVITGSNFSDLIFGNAGNDFVNGGFGSDRINGGTGADRFFHIGSEGHGSDWIQDYANADGDVLLYGGSAARSDFQVNTANTAAAGDAGVDEAFIIYRPTGQILWALVDGAGEDEIILRIAGQEFDLLA